MYIDKGSVSVIVLGDWNKAYVQPEWMASKVFGSDEIEIGVEGAGLDIIVSYKCDKVIINPTQSKIVLTALDTEVATLRSLSKCVANFLNEAHTPTLFAYGINADYVDEDNTILATNLDLLSDKDAFSKMGYNIRNTRISRTIQKNDLLYNIEFISDNKTTIRFNEHHERPVKDFSYERVEGFLIRTGEIVKELGFALEDKYNAE